jgi:hypothetical protein
MERAEALAPLVSTARSCLIHRSRTPTVRRRAKVSAIHSSWCMFMIRRIAAVAAITLSLVPAFSSVVGAASLQGRELQWSLSSSPTTSIGGGDDPRESITRAVTVLRLPDGRILLWEPRPASVRLFAANGRFLRIFAREGAGPGEVRDANWIGFNQDTVFVFDRTQRRLTRFRSSGEVLTTVPFRPVGTDQSYRVIGRWRDGTLVLRSLDGGMSGRGTDGIRRDSVWLAVAAENGAGLKQLVEFPGVATFTKAVPGGGAYVARQPFGPEGLAAVGNNIVWLGDNSTPTLVAYDQSGRTTRRVRVPFESTPVERRAADARRLREVELARSPATQVLVNAKFAALPERNPFYSGLAVAPNGDLWITEAIDDDNIGPQVAVLSPEGSVRARLRVPARFRIVQVDDSLVTGIYRDTDDVEYVRVYAIRR